MYRQNAEWNEWLKNGWVKGGNCIGRIGRGNISRPESKSPQLSSGRFSQLGKGCEALPIERTLKVVLLKQLLYTLWRGAGGRGLFPPTIPALFLVGACAAKRRVRIQSLGRL